MHEPQGTAAVLLDERQQFEAAIPQPGAPVEARQITQLAAVHPHLSLRIDIEHQPPARCRVSRQHVHDLRAEPQQ